MSGLQTRRRARRGDALRQRLEAAVDRAIAALDAYDGDADLEPSLGWPEGRHRWGSGGTDDREEQCEGEGDYDEREPSCGWSLTGIANSAASLDPATVIGGEL